MKPLFLLSCLMISLGAYAADPKSKDIKSNVNIEGDIVQVTPPGAKNTNQVININSIDKYGNEKSLNIGYPAKQGKSVCNAAAPKANANCENKVIKGAAWDRKQLANSNFTKANLSNGSFVGASLTNATFVQSNVTQGNFSSADLVNADFEGANLTKSKFNGADLTNTSFVNATLVGADLQGARTTNTDFDGANLTGAKWIDGRICGGNSIGTCSQK